MSELRVLAFDVHDRLVRLRDLAVVEGGHLEILSRRLPQRRELVRDLEDFAGYGLVGGPIERRQESPGGIESALRAEVAVEERVGASAVAVVTRAHVKDRERLVRPDDDRVGMLLEDLHRHALVPLVPFEDELRAREVDVALVAGADLLDRETENVRPQTLGNDHVRPPKSSRMPGPVWTRSTAGPPASASRIRSTCFRPVFAGRPSSAK